MGNLYNFIKRNPQYHTVDTTPLAAERKAAHKREIFENYFKGIHKVVEEKGIHPNDFKILTRRAFELAVHAALL